MSLNNLFPFFNKTIQREDKERLLNQKSKALWFTGLSGAGKTTIALELEKRLYQQGFITQILDGDNIRVGICNNLKFTEDDRHENIRRVAEVSKLFVNCGIITINCFITPTKEMRALAKSIIGDENFIEIYVNAPLKTCEERDVKGLYKKARQGLIKNFTGIDSPYCPPENPDIEIRTDEMDINESIKLILDALPIKTEENIRFFTKVKNRLKKNKN